MKSKLAIFVALSGWFLFFVFIFYEFKEQGINTLRNLFNLERPAETIFHIVLFTVPIGATITAYLINEREELFDKIYHTEKEYRDLVDNALIGIYKTNLKGDILYANNALAKMFEFASPEELMSEKVQARYKNPADREVLTERLKKTDKVENFETNMIAKTGKIKNVLANATIEGATISGMVIDITARKQAEEQLIKQSTELKIINAELEALYTISSKIGQTIDTNELFTLVLKTVTGLEVLDVEPKGGIFLVDGEKMKLISHLGHPEEFLKLHEDMKVGDCLCGLTAKTGEIIVSLNSEHDSRHTIRYPGITPHGHIVVPLKVRGNVVGVLYLYIQADRHVDERILNILLSIGNQIGMAIENARLYEKTKELSLHDPLTGLANRRLMDIMLENNFAMAKRSEKPFSVMMLDIDHFKEYNDTFGHAAGDKLLIQIAKSLLETTRGIDLVVRYGGEEFLILLPDAEMSYAYKIAERIRKAIDEETGITVSLGIASYHQGIHKKEELINKADDALYKAKQRGRNRIEVSE